MSRILKVMIALLAITVIAAPAMAEIKLNGYYRLQGTSQSLGTNKQKSSNFTDHRLRMKVSNQLNENINIVWYGEVDTPFGESGSTPSNGAAPKTEHGGKLSADGVNVETKNVYVDFKIPNSSWSVRTGVQGYGFGKYESFVTNDDMAGISARGDLGPIHLKLGAFNWEEGSRDSADDAVFYRIEGEMPVSEQFKFGLTAALISNNGATAVNKETAAKTDEYYYGAYADYVMNNLGFAGSFLVKNASGQDSGATDGDTWMLNLYAKMALNHGKVKFHAIYIPADDSTNGTDRFGNNQAGWELHSDNLMIFGTDVYYNNGSQGAAFKDAAYKGYGLFGLTVSGDYQLPEASYLKYGAGYFMAADDSPDSTTAKTDASLGLELAAQVGKKFAEKYDLSIRGSYGFMGDFYGATVEDTYKTVAMLNISF